MPVYACVYEQVRHALTLQRLQGLCKQNDSISRFLFMRSVFDGHLIFLQALQTMTPVACPPSCACKRAPVILSILRSIHCGTGSQHWSRKTQQSRTRPTTTRSDQLTVAFRGDKRFASQYDLPMLPASDPASRLSGPVCRGAVTDARMGLLNQ